MARDDEVSGSRTEALRSITVARPRRVHTGFPLHHTYTASIPDDPAARRPVSPAARASATHYRVATHERRDALGPAGDAPGTRSVPRGPARRRSARLALR